MTKQFTGLLYARLTFHRGRCCFSLFSNKVLIYVCFLSILVVFYIFTTTPDTVQKLSMKMAEQSVDLTSSWKETTEPTPGASCQPLHFIPHAETYPVTALASFPGSGNTWLRHLIQQSTGILTGAEYTSEELFNNGFPGQGVINSSVVVVKTHELLKNIKAPYQKAVLLIRHPKPAIQAAFNFFNSPGHVGCATIEDYERYFGLYWNFFVKWNILDWQKMNIDWIHNFKGPLHIVLYDELRNDLGPTLRSLVQFLDLPLNETAIQCTVENNEGLYHRKPCPEEIDHFTEDMNKIIVREEKYVFNEVDKFVQSKRENNVT